MQCVELRRPAPFSRCPKIDQVWSHSIQSVALPGPRSRCSDPRRRVQHRYTSAEFSGSQWRRLVLYERRARERPLGARTPCWKYSLFFSAIERPNRERPGPERPSSDKVARRVQAQSLHCSPGWHQEQARSCFHIP
jgi:hypothetical protein